MIAARRRRFHASAPSLALAVAIVASIAVVSPVATKSASSAVRHAPPRKHGYFATLRPGAKLPTGLQCAARVHRSKWEPRRENATQNAKIVPQPVHLPNNDGFNSTWQKKYKPRINGRFRGTTDEIIQWASCKWGISDELTRARAVKETDWRQSETGDFESRSNGHCTPGSSANPCPTSFGLLQSKWYYRPGTYPRTRVSTAFMLDSALAETRGCLDGLQWFGPQSRGNVWGCVGVWYSGSWGEGSSSYVASVKSIYRSKPWRRWPG